MRTDTVVAVLVCLVSSIALIICGSLGGSTFAQSGFVRTGLPSIGPGLPGGYTGSEFFGVALLTVCLPLSLIPTLLGLGIVTSSTDLSPTLRFSSLVVIGGCFGILAALAYNSWHGKELLECGLVVFCVFNEAAGIVEKEMDHPNGFETTTGSVMFLSCITLALTSVLSAFLLLIEEGDRSISAVEAEDQEEAWGGDRVPLLHESSSSKRDDGKCKRVLAAAVLLVTVTGFVSATTVLPSTWLQMTPNKISTVGAMEVGREAEECHIAASSSSVPPLFPFQRRTCPEIEGSLMRTAAIEISAADKHNNHDRVVAKLYPDVVIYFTFLYSLIALGFTSAVSERANRLLMSRIPLPLSQTSLTLLEAVVLLLFGITIVLFCLHWFHDHNWHSYWPKTLPWVQAPSTAEKIARTTGQLGNMLTGLLFLPVSRNSLWSLVFRIPWERIIVVHRMLGYGLLLTLFVHMVAWWVVFSEQGVFPHDAFAVKMFFPLNFHAKPGHCSTLSCLDPEYQQPAADNWTIPLANFFMLFLGFPIFGVLTWHSVRRKFFEVFYFSHHIFVVFLVVVLWHANSSWYFVSFPVFLWVYDRLLRFFRGMFEARDSTAFYNPCAGVTQLTFSTQKSVAAGQFVMINVPEVSLLQWHPFSLSGLMRGFCSVTMSARGDFTNAVLCLNDDRLRYRVDGPYGVPFSTTSGGVEHLVLVAGGIGCTPFMALLDEMLTSSKRWPLLQHVSLVWVFRSIDLLSHFAPQLEQFKSSHFFSSRFSFRAFCTGLQSNRDAFALQENTMFRKPSISLELHTLLDEMDGLDVAMIACGPNQLVRDAESVSIERRVKSFRHEVFDL